MRIAVADPLSSLAITPIGIIHSCFKEKFGIPRQPNLAPSSRAEIELLPPFNLPETIEGLESCSHIWIQFIFHANHRKLWKPKVKPPRLGGNRSMGVFATRSPTRPNPIGLSVVKLESIDCSKGVRLTVSGHDLLDGTPVLDIKPYIPYVDAVVGAENAFASGSPATIDVLFTDEVANAIAKEEPASQNLDCLIHELLAQDPRPAYQKVNTARIYGMIIYEYNVRWRYLVEADRVTAEVISICPADK